MKRNRFNYKRAKKLSSEAYKEGPQKKWYMHPKSTNLEGSNSRLKDMEWEDLEEDDDNDDDQTKNQRWTKFVSLIMSF